MGKPRKTIFISYDTESGLEYAHEAWRIFTDSGNEAWMWDANRAPGGYPAEQIAENIKLCDIFFYLCTAEDGAPRWNGQPYERNLAWQLNKPYRVITFDSDLVPLMLRAYTYIVVSGETFVTRCTEVVDQLATQPILEKTQARNLEEVQPLASAG
jgi:hypothetical protein